MKSIVSGLLLFALFCLPAYSQEKSDDAAPPSLDLTATGRQHHPIRTSSAEAQAYFDQGLTFVYGFNHEEAIRAFREAARLDPASPMPLWGIALATGPNYNLDVDADHEKAAFETVSSAAKLAEAGNQIEKDYVAALAARYSGEADPDYRQLSLNYAAAMKQLSEKYPDDLDAATLYAESLMNLNPWKLWTHDGAPGERTLEIVRVLESVLRRDPQHAGANHFYIHAVEASPDPARAAASAHRLENLVPRAGHLVHMPAHVYIRTGDYAAAVSANERAAEADRVYAERADQQGSLYDLMYHSHNEHFLAAAASMEGRYAEARAAADAMAARLLPHAEMMPMLDAFIMTPLWVDARFQKWDAILAREEPSRALLGTHIFWRYARGLAFAARGQGELAAKESSALAEEAKAVPENYRLGDQNTAPKVMAIARHVLAARLASAKGAHSEAVAHWREAVETQDAMNYAEPPDWYYPVRESLGAELFRAGQFGEAESVFREDLRRNPRNPRSLFGLLQSLKAQHREEDAAWVQRQFDAAWKNAGQKLEMDDL